MPSHCSPLTPHSCGCLPQRSTHMGRRSHSVHDPKEAHPLDRGSLCSRRRACQGLYPSLLPSPRITRCLQDFPDRHLGCNCFPSWFNNRILHQSFCRMPTFVCLLGAIKCPPNRKRYQVQLQRRGRCHHCRWHCVYDTGCDHSCITQLHLLESQDPDSPEDSPDGNLRYRLRGRRVRSTTHLRHVVSIL